MALDTERFLTELRQSHKQGAFTDYVKEHWHEAVSHLEDHDMQMDDVNVMISETEDDSEFEDVIHDVIDELEESHEPENPIEELN
ncbi:hypothetical protein [Enterococcus sp. 3C8_DIV0646]|uniref:hypothetical protein n=1 Tax=Enterococcus sp. 3C8_DIV0646 TaxID=1834175 RepID=UPI000A33BBFE|nr:hypothetical protein [Enterococcus sp. 3C8_DIV0646]OTO30033.1 hypothetical protein A5876_000599 [Enterococcus sp. 3C8_DIV0646]